MRNQVPAGMARDETRAAVVAAISIRASAYYTAVKYRVEGCDERPVFLCCGSL